MSTHNLCFEQKYEKYQNFFLSDNFHFWVLKFSVYLNRHVFVMGTKHLWTVKEFSMCNSVRALTCHQLSLVKPVLSKHLGEGQKVVA